jgi:dihydrofolate reductase
MIVSLVVALTPTRVIGRDNQLPWRLSEDLKRFKRITLGHHLLMGRKTYESIGRPLPGRTSIVVTRQLAQWAAAFPPGVIAANSLPHALSLCGDDPEVFVVGGGEIFREAIELAQRAYVTWVDADIPGDTFFPAFPTSEWVLQEETSVPADAKNEYPTRYCVYERRSGGAG